MPTYEYACQSCGYHLEVYQRFSDAPMTECAVCGGPLRKVFHPAGILFKGSGFYATDSRRSAVSGDGHAERKAESVSSSSTSAASPERKTSDPSTSERKSSRASTSKEKSA